MFGSFRAELFPDDCKVIEIPPYNQWVYLIFKNGSSSLMRTAEEKKYRILCNKQLYDLSAINIYIRKPQARYVSGVNSYLHHLLRDNPELDRDTILWFVKQYPFLNRHYLPQFYWIQNLSRFISQETVLQFHDFSTFNQLTSIKDKAEISPPDSKLVDYLFRNNPDIEIWLYLDRILLDFCGQSLTWYGIQEHYLSHHPTLAPYVLS